MLINSLEFLLFVLALILLYKITPAKAKWGILLIASYIFYFLNSTYLILFILITTLSIYFVGLIMRKIDEKTKVQVKEIDDKEQKKHIKAKAKTKKKITLIVRYTD